MVGKASPQRRYLPDEGKLALRNSGRKAFLPESSRCKGPEVEVSFVCYRNRKERGVVAWHSEQEKTCSLVWEGVFPTG